MANFSSAGEKERQGGKTEVASWNVVSFLDLIKREEEGDGEREKSCLLTAEVHAPEEHHARTPE